MLELATTDASRLGRYMINGDGTGAEKGDKICLQASINEKIDLFFKGRFKGNGCFILVWLLTQQIALGFESIHNNGSRQSLSRCMNFQEGNSR